MLSSLHFLTKSAGLGGRGGGGGGNRRDMDAVAAIGVNGVCNVKA